MKYRYSILIFILTLPFGTKSQQLPEGTFEFSNGFEYVSLTIKPNYRFNYVNSSCVYEEQGSGTYSFKKKILTLAFDDSLNKKVVQNQTITRTQSQSDTTYLFFYFTNQNDSMAIPGIIALYANKAKKENYGTQSDEYGRAKLGIKNEELPIDIQISSLGIKPRYLKIDSSGTYQINYPINLDRIQLLRKGEISIFKISNFNEDEVILKPIIEKHYMILTRKAIE